MQVYNGAESVGSPLAGFTDPNKWLKLTRQGNIFTSYQSTDGKTWTQIGHQTVPMTGPVDIGLFDNAHNSRGTLLTTTAFDHVKVTKVPVPGPLPKPWADTDVGSPAIAGSAGYTAKTGTFTVNGAGTDIFGPSDQFNYVYQPLAGDGNGTIIARVTSQTDTSSNAKSGVIIKQSTTAGSDYFLIEVQPGGIVKVQYDFNGSSTVTSIYNFPNVWMKLVSLNGAFTAYLSGNGKSWTPWLSKTVPITFPATIGLFECSHNSTQLGTATFDHVSVTPGP
jgi:regulation of enolase protein 1 (concanavalin A-like superfamily)